MKLYTGLTLVLFTLKLLGLFSRGWLVVFSPSLIGMGIEVLLVTLISVVEHLKN